MTAAVDTAWLGRADEKDEIVSTTPLRCLAALLDRSPSEAGAAVTVPPLWHWALFLPSDLHAAIGEDGHLRRGGFLPPIGLPRRMWAGPLIATLLLDELHRSHPHHEVETFSFKAVSPLFDTEPFHVCGRLEGKSAALWAARGEQPPRHDGIRHLPPGT